MTRARQLLVSAAVVVVTAAAVLWMAQYVVAESYEKEHGPSGEARSNRFLAAQSFLLALGVETVEAPSNLSTGLPAPHGGVLFHPGDRTELDKGRQRHWLDWAKQGGHLVLGYGSPESPFGLLHGVFAPDLEAGYLSEQLGVTPRTGDLKYTDRAIGVEEGTPWDLDLNERYYLENDRDDIDRVVSGPAGDVLISFPFGDGRVTFFTESGIFQHPAIGKGDRAELLWRVVSLHGTPSHVMIVRGVHVPSLPAWLFEQAPFAVLSLLLWLGLFLSARMQRFGPVLETGDMRRRRLLEHVRASGYYLWKHGRGGRLLEGVRRRVQRDLDRTHPELRGLAPRERDERMARLTGLSEALIARALADGNEPGGDGFAQRIRDLEEIRKRL
ncbi:MAG: DUF4350 domain-containing protein [Gammaproteobacteria bacterium]